MKLAIAALAASVALALTPVGASAQHVDVGPGGVAVHGDRHGDRHDDEHRHSTVEEHHHERPVVHDHHDDVHAHTVVEEHRH
jgi:Ni/Co efflux regulator RcnB